MVAELVQVVFDAPGAVIDRAVIHSVTSRNGASRIRATDFCHIVLLVVDCYVRIVS